MRRRLFPASRHALSLHLEALKRRFIHGSTLSTRRHGVALGADLTRSKPALRAEHALLRQQLIVLQRPVARPHLTPLDRLLLVVLARRTRPWRSALLLVQPDTVLRWPRQGVHLVWGARAHTSARRPRVAVETVAFIRARAQENRRWGAERIRGARLTLGIHVRKGTILKHRRRARPPRQSGQTWATFWHHHAAQLWACDFIPGTALCFRSICAFVLVEHASRRVRPVGVTRHPPDAWVAPQRREATPFGTAPRVLIQDNDATYGPPCDRMAEGRTIDLLATPYQAPRANARCARFIGSVRRACLNHLLVLHEQHLRRILTAYVASFNDERPPQGLVQAIPAHDGGDPAAQDGGGPVACTSIRGG